MAIQLADVTLQSPVMLAPMAGITDLPFRRLVSSFGAGLVVSEMVASQEMVQSRPGARERASLGLGIANTAVQLAGRQVRWMEEGARIVEANGARFIDINMGCPAKRVVGGMSGSALMRDLDHAARLLEAVVRAVRIPVTLKTRLGWNERQRNAPELALRAENAGVKMITVHGRTRCQFFKGRSDWSAIAGVRNAVRLPVVANGDIQSGKDASDALRASGADGVMVGRAVRGAPWLVAEIGADLFGLPRPRIPCGAAFADMVSRHFDETLCFYGTEIGGKVIRKHLGWYMDRAATQADLRREVLTERSPRRVLRLLPAALAGSGKAAA